jgi:ribosomal protein L40E
MRQIDTAEAPQRERAEAMVRAYIAKRGVEGRARPPRGRDGSPERILPGNRVRRDSTSSGPEAGVLCTHCPARNPLDADYCKGCGIFIRSTECTHCSTANDPDAAFCKRCGTVLTAPATPGSKPNAAR